MGAGEGFPGLLAAAKTGAEWAWEQLYRDLAGPVTGYFASRGAPDPEDLTGETFLQVARGIHSFEGHEGSFRSWVFVIAHRRMIDARRVAGRSVAVEPIDALEARGGNVEEEAMVRLGTAELVRGLRVLTDEQREVLALRVMADLTLEETANVVGKTVGAVKALQHRALAVLRRNLEPEGVSQFAPPSITEMR